MCLCVKLTGHVLFLCPAQRGDTFRPLVVYLHSSHLAPNLRFTFSLTPWPSIVIQFQLSQQARNLKHFSLPWSGDINGCCLHTFIYRMKST